MMEWIKNLFGVYSDKLILGGLSRSFDWSAFVKEYEKTHPKVCPFCGIKKCQLHHKYETFAQNPAREKDPENLMWACQGFGTNNCHLRICHLGNFQSLNLKIDEFIFDYQHRPKLVNGKWISS